MNKTTDFRLGQWRVSPSRGLIDNGGVSKRLTPKAVDLLLCLVRHHRQVVTRETLMNEVWQGRAISDEPLNKGIAELRRQLSDVRHNPLYIETIPKRGYRLIADYQPLLPAAAPEHTDSQQQQKSSATRVMRWQPIIITGFVVVIVFGAVLAWVTPNLKPAPAPKSIAVLPFASLSADANKDYFAAGVHEELITALSFNSNFDVRSRTSTLPFANTTLSLPQIAQALDVDLIVEGSVRHEGDQVRVTAQLIEADSDSHLWSSNYQHPLSVENLFATQNRIADDIAAALKLTLQAQQHLSLPTQSLSAYDQFLLGKYHYRRQLPGDIALSVQFLETAVELDPQFADAWDWLAYAYNHAATEVGYLSPAQAYPRARTAALKALEIKPQLASSLSLLGYIRAIYEYDWRGGVSDLRRALMLQPKDSATVWSLAHVLSMLNQHEEAIALTANFAGNVPANGRNFREVANRLIDAGFYADALQWLEKAETNGDEVAHNQDSRGIALLGMGDIDAAEHAFVAAVQASQRSSATLAHLLFVRARLDNSTSAQALLSELLARTGQENVSAYTLAIAYSGLRRDQKAIENLQQAAQQRDRAVLSVRHDVFFSHLQSDQRLLAISDGFNFPTDAQ